MDVHASLHEDVADDGDGQLMGTLWHAVEPELSGVVGCRGSIRIANLDQRALDGRAGIAINDEPADVPD